jgi:hypothetical protein
VKQLLLFSLSLFISFISISQNDTIDSKPNYNDSLITITGKVIDTTKFVSFYNVMIVNKTAGKGIFGSYDGTFKITVKKSDLVGLSVTGYKTQYLSFKNKAYKEKYEVTIYLDLNSFIAEKVEVMPYKTLAELQKERASIAKREVPTVTVASAFESPITALYVAFSKREKTKRLIAEMEFEDQKRTVVKEILRLYVHNDIIDLEDEEFDSFITFLNLNDRFLQTAKDYDLITYIKYKYEHFSIINAEGY